RALATIGAGPVRGNSRYRAFEVEYVLRQSDAKALIMVDRFPAAKTDYLAILDELCPEARRTGGLPGARFPMLRHVVVLGAEVPAGAGDFAAGGGAGARPTADPPHRIPTQPREPRGRPLNPATPRDATRRSPSPPDQLHPS